MRLFVAVWPSKEAVEAIRELPRPDIAELRWTTPHQWHVTLRFLGRIDDVDRVIERFQSTDASAYEDVVAEAGPETAVLSSRVLHIPVSGLEGLAHAIARSLRGIGEKPEKIAFHGHITLARLRHRQGTEKLRELSGTPFRARWSVNELTLVSSSLSPHGARYEVVSSLRLPSLPSR